MLFESTYKIPVQAAESRLNVRGSKFYAYLFPISSEDDFKQHLGVIKQQYPDATHWCYAYILNIDKSNQRYNDDGEPANTAGRPILRQLQAFDLTNVLVIVVRYFGGKLLGVPGLIEAYGETAKLALEQTQIVEKQIEAYYKIEFDYVDEPMAWQLARQSQARIDEQVYNEKGCLIMAVPVNSSLQFEQIARELFMLQWVQIKIG